MPCLVCGSTKTVKSHLIPRAFVSDLRGNEPHVFAGGIVQNRTMFLQSGRFDKDILCDQHEQVLHEADDYAIKFVRRYLPKAVPQFSDHALEVPNPKPNLLWRFAAAVLWRCAVAKPLAHGKLDLGPYKEVLKSIIFENKNPGVGSVFLVKHNVTHDGETQKFVITEPTLSKKLSRRTYMFYIGNLQFFVKLDPRKASIELFNLLDAGKMNPVLILNRPDTELSEYDWLVDLVRKMP